MGVLGWAVHDPHLAGLPPLHGDLRRCRVSLGRRIWSNGWDTRRQAHIPPGQLVSYRHVSFSDII